MEKSFISLRPRISFPKLMNEFRLNFVHGVYTRNCRTNLM